MNLCVFTGRGRLAVLPMFSLLALFLVPACQTSGQKETAYLQGYDVLATPGAIVLQAKVERTGRLLVRPDVHGEADPVACGSGRVPRGVPASAPSPRAHVAGAC